MYQGVDGQGLASRRHLVWVQQSGVQELTHSRLKAASVAGLFHSEPSSLSSSDKTELFATCRALLLKARLFHGDSRFAPLDKNPALALMFPNRPNAHDLLEGQYWTARYPPLKPRCQKPRSPRDAAKGQRGALIVASSWLRH
jgi:hypothetical protein